MDFFARLVALAPKPRVNLTRFHGVFAPNRAHRAQVTPAKRGKGNKARTADAPEVSTPAEHRAALPVSAGAHPGQEPILHSVANAKGAVTRKALFAK